MVHSHRTHCAPLTPHWFASHLPPRAHHCLVRALGSPHHAASFLDTLAPALACTGSAVLRLHAARTAAYGSPTPRRLPLASYPPPPRATHGLRFTPAAPSLPLRACHLASATIFLRIRACRRTTHGSALSCTFTCAFAAAPLCMHWSTYLTRSHGPLGFFCVCLHHTPSFLHTGFVGSPTCLSWVRNLHTLVPVPSHTYMFLFLPLCLLLSSCCLPHGLPLPPSPYHICSVYLRAPTVLRSATSSTCLPHCRSPWLRARVAPSARTSCTRLFRFCATAPALHWVCRLPASHRFHPPHGFTPALPALHCLCVYHHHLCTRSAIHCTPHTRFSSPPLPGLGSRTTCTVLGATWIPHGCSLHVCHVSLRSRSLVPHRYLPHVGSHFSLFTCHLLVHLLTLGFTHISHRTRLLTTPHHTCTPPSYTPPTHCYTTHTHTTHTPGSRILHLPHLSHWFTFLTRLVASLVCLLVHRFLVRLRLLPHVTFLVPHVVAFYVWLIYPPLFVYVCSVFTVSFRFTLRLRLFTTPPRSSAWISVIFTTHCLRSFLTVHTSFRSSPHVRSPRSTFLDTFTYGSFTTYVPLSFTRTIFVLLDFVPVPFVLGSFTHVYDSTISFTFVRSSPTCIPTFTVLRYVHHVYVYHRTLRLNTDFSRSPFDSTFTVRSFYVHSFLV